MYYDFKSDRIDIFVDFLTSNNQHLKTVLIETTEPDDLCLYDAVGTYKWVDNVTFVLSSRDGQKEKIVTFE